MHKNMRVTSGFACSSQASSPTSCFCRHEDSLAIPQPPFLPGLHEAHQSIDPHRPPGSLHRSVAVNDVFAQLQCYIAHALNVICNGNLREVLGHTYWAAALLQTLQTSMPEAVRRPTLWFSLTYVGCSCQDGKTKAQRPLRAGRSPAPMMVTWGVPKSPLESFKNPFARPARSEGPVLLNRESSSLTLNETSIQEIVNSFSLSLEVSHHIVLCSIDL